MIQDRRTQSQNAQLAARKSKRSVSQSPLGSFNGRSENSDFGQPDNLSANHARGGKDHLPIAVEPGN
jgi:hypothetical protein